MIICIVVLAHQFCSLPPWISVAISSCRSVSINSFCRFSSPISFYDGQNFKLNYNNNKRLWQNIEKKKITTKNIKKNGFNFSLDSIQFLCSSNTSAVSPAAIAIYFYTLFILTISHDWFISLGKLNITYFISIYMYNIYIYIYLNRYIYICLINFTNCVCSYDWRDPLPFPYCFFSSQSISLSLSIPGI